MFYQPEIFVYLMLLPVFCLVVIPATLSLLRLAIGKVAATHEMKHESSSEQDEQEAYA